MSTKTQAFLTQADDALTKGQADRALTALVRAWAARPLPALASVVDRFEAAFPPVPFEGDTSDFVKRAAKATPADLGGLARSLVGPKTGDVIARLEALGACAADPRVSAALLRLVHDAPWTSDGARPVWTTTFALLRRLADPRLLEVAKTLPAAWKFRENQRAWMQRQLDGAVAAVQAVRAEHPVAPLSTDEANQLQAFAARLKPTKTPATTSERSGEALLAEVYARPDDDAPRLVYADWCLERELPHGEFITLQFKADKTKAEAKREAALLKAHGTTWLGALANVTLKNPVFRRGFPSTVVARFKGQRDVEKAGDAPEWATVEDLSWSLPGAWSNDEARWLEHLPRHARPRRIHVHQRGLVALLDATSAWSIEELTFSSSDVEVERRLADSTLFPHVRLLRVTSPRLAQAALLSRGWLRDVAEVRVESHNPEPLPWLEALSFRQQLTFERSGDRFHFTRGDDGRLSRLRVEAAGDHARTGLLLASLPEGFLTSLEGVAARHLEAVRSRVRSAGTPAPAAITPPTKVGRALTAIASAGGWRVVRESSFDLCDSTGRVLSSEPINDTTVAAFSPDGLQLLCGGVRRIDWRDGRTGAFVKKEALTEKLFSAVWTPDGSMLALHFDKHVEVRAWPSNEVVWTLKSGAYPKKPTSVALSPDGAFLVTTQYTNELQVWAPGAKRPVKTQLPNMLPAAAFVSRTDFVVSCRDGLLRRFDARSPGEPTSTKDIPESHRLLIDPTGRLLACGDMDAWVKTGRFEVLRLPGLEVALRQKGPRKILAFSADGTRLLCAAVPGLVVHEV